MPKERARASPSEAGSMPVNSTNSICPGCLRSLYIKSLPILPDPMIATFTLFFAECCAPISRSPSFSWDVFQHRSRMGYVHNEIFVTSHLCKPERYLSYFSESSAEGIYSTHRDSAAHGTLQDDMYSK